MNKQWIEVFRNLADDPEDFDCQGGQLVFVRRGREYDLTLRQRPGAGLCVVRTIETQTTYVPVAEYVQRDLLELPRLALQIQKSLERLASRRPARYIDGPASIETTGSARNVENSHDELSTLLAEGEPGVTNLVQLMAPAGHGKTVLLEQVANSSAKIYRPEDNPYPLVLLVDLLGRFVGNIDDAIAGAINNTYAFPSLTQRDVIVALKNRWLTLALDGFDELVARIGPKDAFLRISDLLDQMDGSGNLIISARESFFELYRITIAIRSYLQPKRGTFNTSVVRLLPWSTKQGVEVFRLLGSHSPGEELNEFRSAFDDDIIAFQPFFLTRLAELWRKGERFRAEKHASELSKVRYVVERLLEREAVEKWRDSKGNPILDKAAHELVLCTIAEEMFRTGAFFLRVEEVRVAAQIALEEQKIPTATIKDAIERFPTHAFLQTTERGYRFTHDKFLHYFLGVRLAHLAVRHPSDFLKCIEGKELTPEVVAWIVECLPDHEGARIEIAQQVIAAIPPESGPELKVNIGALIPRAVSGIACHGVLVFKSILFSGDGLKGLWLQGVVFSECTFSSIDWTCTKLNHCEFSRCKIDTVVIDDQTDLAHTTFDQCEIGSLHLNDKDRTFYSPKEVDERLSLLRATVAADELLPKRVLADDVPEEYVHIVERLVKASHKGWDICIEEFVERWGAAGQRVIDRGLEIGALRTWNRDVGGPRRHFVRFQIDRNRLLQSLHDSTVDPVIERFWRSLVS